LIAAPAEAFQLRTAVAVQLGNPSSPDNDDLLKQVAKYVRMYGVDLLATTYCFDHKGATEAQRQRVKEYWEEADLLPAALPNAATPVPAVGYAFSTPSHLCQAVKERMPLLSVNSANEGVMAGEGRSAGLVAWGFPSGITKRRGPR
jgi:hypothetical protein